MSRYKSIIIMGIDPGLATTGYAIIEKELSKLTKITYGCIITKPNQLENFRLNQIYQDIKKLIKEYQPKIIGIEKLFFCKNVKTALSVGQARGVLLLAASQTKISVREFTPLQVKQTVTSYGQANKQQVQKMVQTILSLSNPPKPDDAADALAVAICCAHHLVG